MPLLYCERPPIKAKIAFVKISDVFFQNYADFVMITNYKHHSKFWDLGKGWTLKLLSTAIMRLALVGQANKKRGDRISPVKMQQQATFIHGCGFEPRL